MWFTTPTPKVVIGWIYTTENDWYRFGNVSLEKTLSVGIFDSVGIATTTPGKVLKVAMVN